MKLTAQLACAAALALIAASPALARGTCYEDTHVTLLPGSPYGNLYWRDSFVIRTPNHVCDNDRPPSNYFIHGEEELVADVEWDAQRLCQNAQLWFGERCRVVHYTISGDFSASGAVQCVSPGKSSSVE